MIHFHNGDITAALARRAGVPGRRVPYRESLIGGPVRRDLAQLDWVEERARYLAEEHGENLLRVRNELLEQEKTIGTARAEEEIVLWFEHDLFCLVHLLYLTKRFANCRLTLIWNPTPLGLLDVEAVLALYRSRMPMTPMREVPGEGEPKASFAVTPAARNVLAESVDFLDVNTPNVWLGGAHLTREKVWRWDAERGLLT